MAFPLTFLQPFSFLSAAFQIRAWNKSTSALPTACSHLSLGHGSLARDPPCCIMRPVATFVILCILYNQVYHFVIFFNVRQAKQPAITGEALCHKNVARPRSRLSHGHTSSKISSRFFFGDNRPSLLSCQPNEFCSGVESATSSSSICRHPHCIHVYRVIHKSLRDFRTRLRNNQDRHGRKEHINR